MLHTIWGPGMELREEELLRREQRNRQVHDGFKIGKPASQLQLGGRPLHRRLFTQRASTAAGRPKPASCGAIFWAIGSPRRP